MATRIKHAVGGKLARCLRSCAGGIRAALADAASDTVEASIRSEALDDDDGGPLPDAYIVSIRKEDRERFEETVSGVRARWIGETTRRPAGA